MIAFLMQNMTLPDVLIQASIGVGTTSSGREQAEKIKLDLEIYRNELLC